MAESVRVSSSTSARHRWHAAPVVVRFSSAGSSLGSIKPGKKQLLCSAVHTLVHGQPEMQTFLVCTTCQLWKTVTYSVGLTSH